MIPNTRPSFAEELRRVAEYLREKRRSNSSGLCRESVITKCIRRWLDVLLYPELHTEDCSDRSIATLKMTAARKLLHAELVHPDALRKVWKELSELQ